MKLKSQQRVASLAMARMQKEIEWYNKAVYCNWLLNKLNIGEK